MYTDHNIGVEIIKALGLNPNCDWTDIQVEFTFGDVAKVKLTMLLTKQQLRKLGMAFLTPSEERLTNTISH